MAEPLIDVSRECLDDELIAAFIDGRLRQKQRTFVAGHLASCGNCCEIFAETVRMQKTEAGHYEDGQNVSWKRMMIPAAAILSVAACWVLVVSLPRMSSRSEDRPELASLVAAVGARRPIEPRLTGGFAYGPLQTPYRSSATEDSPPDVRIAAAQLEVNNQLQTARLRGAIAIAALIAGRSREAVTGLEKAVGEAPDDALLLSDLSAAHLVSAERGAPANELTKALSAAVQATTRDSSLKEAWFNRALALEQLRLTSEARTAWNDYLKVDGSSPWADEARHRLRNLIDSAPSRPWQ